MQKHQKYLSNSGMLINVLCSLQEIMNCFILTFEKKFTFYKVRQCRRSHFENDQSVIRYYFPLHFFHPIAIFQVTESSSLTWFKYQLCFGVANIYWKILKQVRLLCLLLALEAGVASHFLYIFFPWRFHTYITFSLWLKKARNTKKIISLLILSCEWVPVTLRNGRDRSHPWQNTLLHPHFPR